MTIRNVASATMGNTSLRTKMTDEMKIKMTKST